MSLVPFETFMIKNFEKICDVLRDLVVIVQFKKRGKYPRKNVTFSKVTGFYHATLLKVTAIQGCFS